MHTWKLRPGVEPPPDEPEPPPADDDRLVVRIRIGREAERRFEGTAAVALLKSMRYLSDELERHVFPEQ